MNYGDISPKTAQYAVNGLLRMAEPSWFEKKFMPPSKPLTRKEKIVLKMKRISRRIKLVWLVLRTGECDCDY